LLLCTHQAMAQTTVKGILADSLSNEVIPFATVAVPDPAQPGMYAMATVTDVDGSFSGVIKKDGKYQLTISFMGKMPVTREVSVSGQKTIDLGRILTTDVADTLGEVVVTAVKPLVKAEAGKLTYNAQGDPESKTASVLDLLRKVPMVSVDGEDNITVNGNSSFQVHVNGKKNQMYTSRPSESMKSLPASSVLDIEVITDPGAKYDAEGVGGIINLITERGQKVNQTNGTITIGTSTQQEHRASFNVATNQNKLTLSVSGSLTKRAQQDITMSSSTQNLLSNEGAMNSEYSGKIKNGSLWGNMDLQASYEIDTLNLISVNMGASLSGGDRDNEMIFRMYNAAVENTTTQISESDSKWKDIWAGFDYQHNFRHNPKSMLTLSYKFSGDKSDDPSLSTSYTPTMTTYRDQKNKEVSGEHTLQLDYILPIGKSFTLEDGIKYIYRPKNSEGNDISTYIPAGSASGTKASTTEELTSDDKIVAAYAQITGKYGNYTIKGGIRYEYTFNSVDQKNKVGGQFSKDYSTFVPTASVTYNITPMQNISLTYGMRISRPSIWFLNPYVDKSNPTSWSYGNPELTPEKYHNFSIGYGNFGMKQSLNLTLRYSTCSTGITSYTFMGTGADDLNVMHSTYTNGTENHSLSLNAYYSYNFRPTTRLMLNASASYTDLSNSYQGLSNSGWGGNFYGQFSQNIFWDIKASLGAMVSLRRYNLNGYSDGMSFGTLSFTKDLMNKKLTISLSGNCSLKDFDKMIFKSHSETPSYVSDMRFEIPMGRIQISATWRFGKSHVQVRKANVSIDNDDAGEGKGSDIPSGGM